MAGLIISTEEEIKDSVINELENYGKMTYEESNIMLYLYAFKNDITIKSEDIFEMKEKALYEYRLNPFFHTYANIFFKELKK